MAKPIRGHEVLRGSRIIVLLFLQPRLETEVGWQRHAPADLPPGMTRYPLYRRLVGLHSLSWQVGKVSPPPVFDPQTVQPVASRYND